MRHWSEDDGRYADIVTAATDLQGRLTGIEETIYPTKMEDRQDPLNYPIRLNDKLTGIMWSASLGDHPPSASILAVRDELTAAIDEQLTKLDALLGSGLMTFNGLAASYSLPAVAAEKKS